MQRATQTDEDFRQRIEVGARSERVACEYSQPSQVLVVAPVAVVRQDLEADLAIMRESAMKLQMSMGTAIAQALRLSLVQRLQHC